MATDLYPLVIVKDRYTGVYSDGVYTAWNLHLEEIPQDIEADDVSCRNFWYSYTGIVGLGGTPSDAVNDLQQKLAEQTEPQTYTINPKEPTNMPKCFDCEDFFTCDGQCDEIECEK